MTKRQHAEIEEVLDAIRARPVAGMRVNSPTLIKSTNAANWRRPLARQKQLHTLVKETNA
jgi:hypothetical protein